MNGVIIDNKCWLGSLQYTNFFIRDFSAHTLQNYTIQNHFSRNKIKYLQIFWFPEMHKTPYKAFLLQIQYLHNFYIISALNILSYIHKSIAKTCLKPLHNSIVVLTTRVTFLKTCACIVIHLEHKPGAKHLTVVIL